MYKLKRIKPEKPIPEQSSDNLHVQNLFSPYLTVIQQEEDCNSPHHRIELITSIFYDIYGIFEISKINDMDMRYMFFWSKIPPRSRFWTLKLLIPSGFRDIAKKVIFKKVFQKVAFDMSIRAGFSTI